MTDAVLTLNIGSSSIKCAVFEAGDAASRLADAEISDIGGRPVFRSFEGRETAPREWADIDDFPAGHDALTGWLLDWIARKFPSLTIVAAGHRIVHGGCAYAEPVLLTPDVLDALTAIVPLAPDHQPFNLAGVRIAAEHWSEIPQIGCFDTAFHRTQPRIAQLYGLPRELTNDGIIRFGFHGLSYEHIAETLPAHAGARADGRVIVAHLGHGASMCALVGRKSQATSMGFTALDGLIMGRRCGALDPGVILHLMRTRNMNADEIEELLSRKSGLLGVSGLSSDMRVLLKSDNPHAKEAVDLFVYRAAREIGALAAIVGGLDILVFTGGIGENAAEIRARLSSACAWLGAKIDDKENEKGVARISADRSAVDIFVLPTDEERVIAQSVNQLISSQPRRRSELPPAKDDEHA